MSTALAPPLDEFTEKFMVQVQLPPSSAIDEFTENFLVQVLLPQAPETREPLPKAPETREPLPKATETRKPLPKAPHRNRLSVLPIHMKITSHTLRVVNGSLHLIEVGTVFVSHFNNKSFILVKL